MAYCFTIATRLEGVLICNANAETTHRLSKPRLRWPRPNEDRTLAERAQQFDACPTQITQWKRQRREGAVQTFDNGQSATDWRARIAALHAKVGELSMECDFLERGLVRLDSKRGGP